MNNARVPPSTCRHYRDECMRDLGEQLELVNQYRCELMLWKVEANAVVAPIVAVETNCANLIGPDEREEYRREALEAFLTRKAEGMTGQQPDTVGFRGVEVVNPAAGEPMEAWRVLLEGHAQHDPNAAVVERELAMKMVRDKAKRVNTHLGWANVARELVKLWSYELGERVSVELESDFFRQRLLRHSTARTRNAGQDHIRAREEFLKEKGHPALEMDEAIG